MGIKEMLAAKKATANGLETPKPVDSTVVDVSSRVIEEPVETKPVEETISEPVKPAPASVSVGKPLSFAEKMALKKKQESNSVADVDAQPVSGNSQSVIATSENKKDTEEKKVAIVSTVKSDSANSIPPGSTAAKGTIIIANAVAVAPSQENVSNEDPELSQAYQDIHTRIQELSELSEEPLEGAMKELKKALMANPSAVSLMLDEDIGKMVIALRKMTGVAMAEATKPKEKKAPKAKNVMLTAEQLATAFDEL